MFVTADSAPIPALEFATAIEAPTAIPGLRPLSAVPSYVCNNTGWPPDITAESSAFTSTTLLPAPKPMLRRRIRLPSSMRSTRPVTIMSPGR